MRAFLHAFALSDTVDVRDRDWIQRGHDKSKTWSLLCAKACYIGTQKRSKSGCLCAKGCNFPLARREAGAKGCTLVCVQEGRIVAAEHRPVDVLRWAALEVNVEGAAD